jgi:hypothetical protein
MKRIANDILTGAYLRLADTDTDFGPNRDAAAMLIAQAVSAERSRASAHSAAALEAIRHAADGSAERVLESFIAIAERTHRAIRTGRGA